MSGVPAPVALSVEPAFRPDLPLIDAHIHLWKPDNFFAKEFLAEVVASGHQVEASVYVECGMGDNAADPAFRSVGEMHFVLEQAHAAAESSHRLCAAIAGAAPLDRGSEVRPVLKALAGAAEGRLRAIRFRAARDDDPVAGALDASYPAREVLNTDAFLEGASCLSDFDLHLELYVFHPQLVAVAKLARRLPHLPIVINHCGGPLGVGRYAADPAGTRREWIEGLRAAAQCPNVSIKISGLAIRRFGYGFETAGSAQSSDRLAALWREPVLKCFDLFGADRLIFASNFPVDRVAGSYGLLLNACKKILGHLPDTEVRLVLAENARRLYRIPT
jgi:L-fuconolactonase